jgi:hypothetical protein
LAGKLRGQQARTGGRAHRTPERKKTRAGEPIENASGENRSHRTTFDDDGSVARVAHTCTIISVLAFALSLTGFSRSLEDHEGHEDLEVSLRELRGFYCFVISPCFEWRAVEPLLARVRQLVSSVVQEPPERLTTQIQNSQLKAEQTT